MLTLVFATNNPHKAREVEQILGSGYTVKTLKDIGCTEEIAETEDTLEGNALLKARYVKTHYGYDCFSEDTGLDVTIGLQLKRGNKAFQSLVSEAPLDRERQRSSKRCVRNCATGTASPQ